jgi:hypothetical protein
LEIDAVIRSQRSQPDGSIVCGLEFLPDQHRARAALALGLFHGSIVPPRDRTLQPVPGTLEPQTAAA